MPREIVQTITVYKFHELPEEIQQKIIDEENKDSWENGYFGEKLEDYLYRELEERGLPANPVAWDEDMNVAFYGELDLEDYFKKNPEIAKKHPQVVAELDDTLIVINRNSLGRYKAGFHNMRITIHHYIAEIEKDVHEFVKDLEAELKSVCELLSKNITDEKNYLENKEHWMSLLADNEYLADGSSYRDPRA